MANFLDTLKFLFWAEIVERYTLLMLMTYLTDVWGLGFVYAAWLINIWVGITKAMPLAIVFIIDNYTGSYWMCLISTTASGIGMGLLSISTPSWLYSRMTGSCSEYSPKCISRIQKSLFYIALVLITIGKSAHQATELTLNFKGNTSAEQQDKKSKVASGTGIVTFIASFILPMMVKSWSIRFGVSAICSLIVARLLVCKSWSYKLYLDVPKRSPTIAAVLRVFMASSSKMFQVLPEKTGSLFKGIVKMSPESLPSSTLRCVEKGEIIRPSNKNMQVKWTRYSLWKAEDTKALILVLLVCAMFIFLGLIRSIGNTFFLEQAERLNPKTIFGLEYPVTSLVVDHNIVESGEDNGVIPSLVWAILCCLFAALVERKRLNVIRRHNLVNKPDEMIPMTIFWLFPQFFALSTYDGMFQQSMHKFFIEKIPSSMKDTGTLLSQGLIGLGMVSNALLVYVIGKISEIGGKPSWFQHTTETSRLDNLYWVLTTLCVMILSLWIQLSNCIDGGTWHKTHTFTTLCVGLIFLCFFLFYP